jgi:cytochrome c553
MTKHLLLTLLLGAQEPVDPALPSSRLDPELQGQVLIEELNCAACHPGDASLSARSRKSPRLAEVGSRIHPKYLEAFIRDPRGTKPGTFMPDLLSRLEEPERSRAAACLTHFLVSMKKGDFAPQAPDGVAAERGRRLFHARGCAACHSPRDAAGTELSPGSSVPLGALETKYCFRSLVDFLRNPRAIRPSGRMPDCRLQGSETDSIAQYLLQGTRVPGALSYALYRGQVWEGLESDQVMPERAGHVQDFALESLGKVAQHTAIRYEGWMNIATPGRHTFFLKMNGGSLLLDGETILRQDPSDRRGVKQLEAAAELAAGWRKIQLTYFHTGRDPAFSFEMAGPQRDRRAIPSSMLSVSKERIPAFEPLRVDAELAARGREYFGKLGCANCHDDLQVPARSATAFGRLDSSRGCLSGKSGPWPRFDLAAGHRDGIAKAIPHAERPILSDARRLDKTLVTFNCIACHERAGLGGIAPGRNALFTGTQPEMGDQGRLPPPLTHVGAKLKPEAIAEVLLRGKRTRGYVDAAMPQFGEAGVGHLVELFGKVDALEPVNIPDIADVQEAKKAGQRLIGVDGLSCIACHEFNGQKSGGVNALDLVGVPERLTKNWFHLYLREPSRFHPLVIMPTYWPGGKAVLPTVLGGDTGRQIEALWLYLEDGGRAKKPAGLSRQSSELRVGDVAEICRGRSPVGYRGIGVGYPERIHLAFDSEEMALRQLWKGEFANVDLGSFQPRGTDRVSFPPGIPFHRLKSLEDSWPYKGKTSYSFPQDLGYQFRGYHLDAQRRPAFLYRYGDLAVEDKFEDVRDPDGKAYFRRTLTFDAPAGLDPFYFRAAAGKSAVRESDRSFGIETLRLRITSEHSGILREGSPAEVLIRLASPQGRSILVLEYRW